MTTDWKPGERRAFKAKLTELVYQHHPDFHFDNASIVDAEAYAEEMIQATEITDEEGQEIAEMIREMRLVSDLRRPN